MDSKAPSLMHVGYIKTKKGKEFLYLRKIEPTLFRWLRVNHEVESDTGVSADSIAEALMKARKEWKHEGFSTLICGFRYTLPERDEHGVNALFYQMAASYQTLNGVYFDESTGHECIVQNASLQARELWRKLKKEERL